MSNLEAFRSRHETHNTGTHPMTFRMPVALIGRLDKLAERIGWNRTQVIVALLQDGLDSIDKHNGAVE